MTAIVSEVGLFPILPRDGHLELLFVFQIDDSHPIINGFLSGRPLFLGRFSVPRDSRFLFGKPDGFHFPLSPQQGFEILEFKFPLVQSSLFLVFLHLGALILGGQTRVLWDGSQGPKAVA